MKIISNLTFGLFILTIAVCFTACKKEKKQENTNVKEEIIILPKSENETVGVAPLQFEGKAVLEVFRGEWCDKCPVGDAELKKVLAANPKNIYAAGIHNKDAFEPQFYNAIASHLGGVGAFPTAAVNRVPASNSGDQDYYVIFSKDYWAKNAANFVNRKVDVGLALETTLVGDKATIKVLVHSTKASAAGAKLTLYIIENSVKSFAQQGADATYMHDYVCRGVLTSATGDGISYAANETFTKDYSFTMPKTMNGENVKVLAFINVIGGNNSEHQILNAQQVKLGFGKNWD